MNGVVDPQAGVEVGEGNFLYHLNLGPLTWDLCLV
jgi:hypothetical protein